MDLLEQPLEDVAFRAYFLPDVVAAGAGAAAWTCLAAVVAAAAAAGLWRLRSSSTPHAIAEAVKPLDSDPRSAPTSPQSETTSTSSSVPAPPSPRERYTAYYYYDNDSGCVGCCDVEGEDEKDHWDLEDDDSVYGPPPSETGPFDWKVVRSLPLGATTTTAPLGATTTTTAEMAPYRSPRGLSGSVVRLWKQGAEGGLTAAAASPRRRGIVVAGVGNVSPSN